MRLDFAFYRPFGIYQLRPRSKRNDGMAPISWIWRHGVEVEELKADSPFGDIFFVCKLWYDEGVQQRPPRVVGHALHHAASPAYAQDLAEDCDTRYAKALQFLNDTSSRRAASYRYTLSAGKPNKLDVLCSVASP